MKRVAKYVEAKCPDCAKPLRVQVGVKSTVREAHCVHCGQWWSYSAWVLKVGQHPTGGRVTVHRVDLVKRVEVIQDVEEVS